MFTARVKRSVTPILKKIDVLTTLNIKAQCNLLQQVTMMSFNQQYSIKNFYFDINQLNNRTLYLIKHIVKSIFNEMFGNPITNSKNLKVDSFIKIIKLQRGFDLPVNERNENGNYPVIGSNGILGKHNLFKCPKGIVTGRSGTIGEVQVYESPFWPLNTTLFSLDTYDNDLIYLKYLLSYFKLERFKEGSGVPTLNRNILHNVKIIDVPNSHQKKFSDIVLLIDKLKLIAQQISKKISIIQKTVFNDFFDGDNFQIKKISECTDTVSGGTPSTSHKEYYENGNIPWITSTEVSQGYINHALKHITKEGLKNSSAKLVPENTVVVAMYCKGTAGKAGLLKIQAATNQALCCILPCNLFNPIYLYHALNNSEHILQSQLKGGVQKNLSQELIRNLEIKVPPILLQNKFADIIKRLDKLKFNFNSFNQNIILLYILIKTIEISNLLINLLFSSKKIYNYSN